MAGTISPAKPRSEFSALWNPADASRGCSLFASENRSSLGERAAADDSALVDRGQKNTERMLKALLGALGFEHVKVVFDEPPKT